MCSAMSLTFNSSQPTGTPPSEHGTASEGGRRQQAGQADALQVTYQIENQSSFINSVSTF